MTSEEYRQTKQSEFEKPITMGVLLEFTDSFLIPKIAELIKDESKSLESRIEERMDVKFSSVDKRFFLLENNLKTYIDRRFSDYTAELFRRLDAKYQKEKQFKEKVLELFKKHSIGSTEDLAYLEGLVHAS